MKTIFNHLATFAITLGIAIGAPSAFAQKDQPDVGFVRIVPVLTAGTGKTRILIDGQDVYPIGYGSSQKTGGIGLKAGAHSITLRKTGIQSAISSFTVNREETLTLIGFAEKVPSKNPNDPPQWKTRVLPLKRNDSESGYHLTLISLCQLAEIKVQAEIPNTPKTQIAYIKHGVPTRLDLGHSKEDLSIKVNGERVASIPLEDPGNYTMVIYEDEKGTTKALSFYDPKLATAG